MVHKQYDEGISAFRRLIPDPAVRLAFVKEIDGFMRKTAMGVWAKDGGLGPRHVEYYNAIYCKGSAVPSILYWDLATRSANTPASSLRRFSKSLFSWTSSPARSSPGGSSTPSPSCCSCLPPWTT